MYVSVCVYSVNTCVHIAATATAPVIAVVAIVTGLSIHVGVRAAIAVVTRN